MSLIRLSVYLLFHAFVLSVALAILSPWRVSAQINSGPEVTVSGTRIRGVYWNYTEPQFIDVDVTLEAYLGIPFAEPPVDDRRFMKPVKKNGLGPMYLANRDRAPCPQFNTDNDDEDCLYLAVYTPSPRPTNAPVMVWIHGGAFVTGSGHWDIYDPRVLMAVAPDMIFVAVNYRLGILGFLTTGDSASPGNYGMFDQTLALEWVQENIAAFGGDPTRVTIMGESAGAASVGIHLLSPHSAGLFNQAIMQSGNALCPWAVDTDTDRQVGFTNELADYVNCTSIDNDALVDCLRTKGVNALLAAQGIMTGKYLLNELLFVPVVDHDFLTDLPSEVVKRGEFHNVPTLLGTNSEEGTLIALRARPVYLRRTDPPTMTLAEFREELPPYLYYNSPLMPAAVEQWYVDWTKADNASANQLQAFIDLNTDQVFACATEAMARALESTGSAVYRYEMTHLPELSVWGDTPGWMGVGHGEDVQYVFGWGLRTRNLSDAENRMSVQFMRYWTNFILSGNPNGAVSSGEYPDWPRYTLPEQEYKILSLTMENGRAMRAGSCAFWLKHAPVLYSYDSNDNDINEDYQEWQQDYEEWRDVHMAEWTAAFDEYKNNDGC